MKEEERNEPRFTLLPLCSFLLLHSFLTTPLCSFIRLVCNGLKRWRKHETSRIKETKNVVFSVVLFVFFFFSLECVLTLHFITIQVSKRNTKEQLIHHVLVCFAFKFNSRTSFVINLKAKGTRGEVNERTKWRRRRKVMDCEGSTLSLLHHFVLHSFSVQQPMWGAVLGFLVSFRLIRASLRSITIKRNEQEQRTQHNILFYEVIFFPLFFSLLFLSIVMKSTNGKGKEAKEQMKKTQLSLTVHSWFFSLHSFFLSFGCKEMERTHEPNEERMKWRKRSVCCCVLSSIQF